MLYNYLGKPAFLERSGECRPLDTKALRLEVTAETPWDKILAKYGATMFYADDSVMADPLGQQFVSGADAHGWHTVALHSEPGQNWAVLERTGAPAVVVAGVLAPVADIVASNTGIAFGKGWYEFEMFGGERFRWVNNDAELIIQRPDPGQVSLLLEVEGGPVSQASRCRFKLSVTARNCRQ